MKHVRLTSRLLPAVCGVLLWAPAARTEPTLYTVDDWHTRIFFEVKSGSLTNYVGMFREFEVDFMFDPEDFGNSRVKASIPVSSFEAFHEGLNARMQEALFEADKYPTIEFEATDIEKTSASTARMTGDLTMHGVTKPVTLDVLFNGSRIHQRTDEPVAGFSARGSLNRHDFGLQLLPVEMVGSIVQIRIELSAHEGDSLPWGNGGQ